LFRDVIHAALAEEAQAAKMRVIFGLAGTNLLLPNRASRALKCSMINCVAGKNIFYV
jgi:hypothetical protein